MLCLNVVLFYGWDILLVGIVWLGKNIGNVNVGIICEMVIYYEMGLYVWDYYVWQIYSGYWSICQFEEDIVCGIMVFEVIIGKFVICLVVVGW